MATPSCPPYMQNQKEQDPCTTAQQVGRLCNLQYAVSPTNFNESNYIPSISTANGCTCSWAIYNLLSACSSCLGQNQYPSWSTWFTNCGSYPSNSYLPSGYTLSSGIPYWAATNPSTWENGVFNPTRASEIGSAAHSDVTGQPIPTSTSTTSNPSTSHTSGIPAGAVAGGVIGAVAIIIIGMFIVFLARRRRRTTPIGTASIAASQIATSPPSIRGRTQPAPSGYAYIPPGPTSPRVLSPTRSVTSLSPLASPVSSGFSSSQGHHMALSMDAADMITPFLTMGPRRPSNVPADGPRTGNSKAAEAQAERIASSSGQQRTRLNPPPYSASTESGPAPSSSTASRRLSMKKQKKRKGSESGLTTRSGHSRTSTKDSTSAFDTGPQTEEGRPHAATLVVARGGTNIGSEDKVNAEKVHDQSVSHRLPVV